MLNHRMLCKISAIDNGYQADGHKTLVDIFTVTVFGADARSTLIEFHFSSTA